VPIIGQLSHMADMSSMISYTQTHSVYQSSQTHMQLTLWT